MPLKDRRSVSGQIIFNPVVTLLPDGSTRVSFQVAEGGRWQKVSCLNSLALRARDFLRAGMIVSVTGTSTYAMSGNGVGDPEIVVSDEKGDELRISGS